MPYKNRPTKPRTPFNIASFKYKLARYAQFRHHQTTKHFTINDYKNFYTGKIDPRQIRDALPTLITLNIITPGPNPNQYTYNPTTGDPLLDDIYTRHKQTTNEKAATHARNTLHPHN